MGNSDSHSKWELFESRLKGELPEFIETYRRAFEAAESIQKMQNHWFYRFGDSIGLNGEIFYEVGTRIWRIATFRG